MSSLEPGKTQYAAMITSPANGIKPVTFVFDTYELLEASLKEAEKELNPRKVEIAFHENRIISYRQKADAHEERKKQLEDPNFKDEEDDDESEEEDVIPMEKV